MITFKKIRWRNFLSTGQHFTEINFQKNNTNLIIGTNGAGKSTVLDALTFVLFNKSFRKITKPQLVNTTNEKECLVEIEFAINAKEYVIRRGIKPNVFDIIIDGSYYAISYYITARPQGMSWQEAPRGEQGGVSLYPL